MILRYIKSHFIYKGNVGDNVKCPAVLSFARIDMETPFINARKY